MAWCDILFHDDVLKSRIVLDKNTKVTIVSELPRRLHLRSTSAGRASGVTSANDYLVRT